MCSSRPLTLTKVLGKRVKGTEKLHSTRGRKAPPGIAFWGIVQLPEKVKVGLHQSAWSKASWDALPVWMFMEPCLRLSSKASFYVTGRNCYPALCPGTWRVVFRVDQRRNFCFLLLLRCDHSLMKSSPLLLQVNWNGWWQRPREGVWRLLMFPLWSCHVHRSSRM